MVVSDDFAAAVWALMTGVDSASSDTGENAVSDSIWFLVSDLKILPPVLESKLLLPTEFDSEETEEKESVLSTFVEDTDAVSTADGSFWDSAKTDGLKNGSELEETMPSDGVEDTESDISLSS